jgi:hypothetical protein
MKSTVGLRVLLVSGIVCLALVSGCTLRQSTQPGTPTPEGPVIQPNASLDADPSWFACKVDTDCSVERGICGAPHAVNSSFLDVFRQYRDKMGQVVDCAVNSSKVSAPMGARCMQQRCLVVPAGKMPAGSKADVSLNPTLPPKEN